MNKNGQMVTADEAKATPKQHTSPCSDCPFARKSMPGWLGSMTADEWMMLAHGEGSADCHATKRPDGGAWACAGLAIYRANVCKSVRDPEALRLSPDRDKVFSFGEFKRHHEKGQNESTVGKSDRAVQAAPVLERAGARVAGGVREAARGRRQASRRAKGARK